MTNLRTWRRWVLLGSVALAASALAADAGYYGYKIFHDPFQWYLADRIGSPVGMSLNAVETATRASFNTWQSVACSYVAFDGGARAGTVVSGTNQENPSDDFSVSSNWVIDANDPYYDLALGGGGSVAAAIPLTYAGAVIRCDIYLNGKDYAWSDLATPPNNAVDVQSAVTREIGHCLGLADGPNPYNVMHWTLLPGPPAKRVLQSEDISQLCGYYPQDGYGSSCAFDGGTGSCVSPQGQTLKCIKAPLSDGGLSTPFCSTGCNVSTVNSCDPPHVCRTSTSFTGFSGACMPNANNVVQVGRACDAGTVAECGPLPKAECLDQGTLPSGAPSFYQGYCTQSCGAEACPFGSSCVNLGGTLGSKCLQSCRTGSGDCRAGYSCVGLPGQQSGVCVSSCAADVDCPNGSPGGVNFCRTCDGLCFVKTNPGAQVGDACSNDSNCGIGQFCFRFSYSAGGVCTQTCATTCSACPNGAFCATVKPNNQQICLRSCQDGTCGPGDTCSKVPEGRACMPACRFDLDCPTGWRCDGASNQCFDPLGAADAGATCALCFAGEGGPGSAPTSPDAGSGGGGGGGCGCQGAPTAELFWAAAAGLSFLVGRRRRWRLR